MMFFRLLLVSFFFVLASAFFIGHGHCVSIKLAWDPNPPEENVKGYRLYYGNEPDHYDYVIDVRSGTLKSVRLKKGYDYHFILTAYNAEGRESEPAGPLAVNTCTYRLRPGRKVFQDTGGIGAVNVITQPNCKWSAASSVSWLRITEGSSGAGTGEVVYSVEPNETYEARTAVSTFAGKFFTLKQKGKKSVR